MLTGRSSSSSIHFASEFVRHFTTVSAGVTKTHTSTNMVTQSFENIYFKNIDELKMTMGCSITLIIDQFVRHTLGIFDHTSETRVAIHFQHRDLHPILTNFEKYSAATVEFIRDSLDSQGGDVRSGLPFTLDIYTCTF